MIIWTEGECLGKMCYHELSTWLNQILFAKEKTARLPRGSLVGLCQVVQESYQESANIHDRPSNLHVSTPSLASPESPGTAPRPGAEAVAASRRRRWRRRCAP